MKIQLTLLMLAIVLMVGNAREINRFNEQKQWKREECRNICWGDYEQCRNHPVVVSPDYNKVCTLLRRACIEDC